MAGVEIRDATDADLPGLVALEEQSFVSDRMAPRSFRRLMRQPSARLRVAVSGRTKAPSIVGYHLVLLRKNSVVARLYSIAVDAAHRGGGVGRRLLADAEHAAAAARRKVLRLEVHERNRRAIRFYEHGGYRQIGAYPAYYGDGAGALRYEKPLTAAGAGRKRRTR